MTPGPHRRLWPLAPALAALLLAPGARAAVQLPNNFVDQVVVGALDEPSSFAFLPDGRLLLIEQRTGKVRLVVNGHIAAQDPVFVVPLVESFSGERGLLGIAIDPQWPARPFVYFFHDRPGDMIRIVRYLASDDVDVPDGEFLSLSAPRLLLDDIPDVFGNHNGGTLRFGPDGMLYASLGDDAVFCDAADSTKLRGKILRLRVNTLPIFGGGVPKRALITPPDNPFVASPDSNARLVYAWGLRNPFRFQIDPVLGTVIAGDVGDNDFEEMDEIGPGDFMGWPWLEGTLPRDRPECPEPGGPGQRPSRAPILAIEHDPQLPHAIISAGPYRPVFGGSNNWPPEYYALRGDVFYSDYYSGRLQRLMDDGTGFVPAPPVPGQPNPADWGRGLFNCADFLVGPDGSLWWVSQFDTNYNPETGTLHRIVYVGPPTGVAEAVAAPGGLRSSPNPSRGAIDVSFTLPEPERARLALYDVSGRRVRVLLDGLLPAGESRARWDGADAAGASAPAGVYFARLERDGAPPLSARVLRLR